MSATRREARRDVRDAVIEALPPGLGGLGLAALVDDWLKRYADDIPDAAVEALGRSLDDFRGIDQGGGLRPRRR